jgi:hypothetical protein
MRGVIPVSAQRAAGATGQHHERDQFITRQPPTDALSLLSHELVS